MGEARNRWSGLAWIGIGCGGLLTVGAILFCAWSYSVSKRIAEADNPTAAIFEMLLRLEPTVESPDDDGGTGTNTFRDWFGNEVRIQSLPGADGTVTISSDDTTTTIFNGSGEAVELPSWLAEYPGTKTGVRSSLSTSNGTSIGSYSFVADDTHEALAFYRSRITALGMTPEGRNYSFGKNTFETVKGRSRDYELSVTASRSDRRSLVVVTYSGPAE
jgi:hypothetical protein